MLLGNPHSRRRLELEVVVDRSEYGDVVGVEILDFRRQLGARAVPTQSPLRLPRWSYDEEMDAFYLRVSEDSAPVQWPTVAVAAFDADGRLASIEVRVAP